MARFDVYSHPDAVLRKSTPYLLDVQNSYLDEIDTRVVIPLRARFDAVLAVRNLNPKFQIQGKNVTLDTGAMAAFPSAQLRTPVTSLASEQLTVQDAIDTLFGAY